MDSYNGKCVDVRKIADLNSLGIDRSQFLDSDLMEHVSAKVDTNADLLFLGNDVTETTKKTDYCLFIHGILPCGSKTTVSITGIFPYIDIKLKPKDVETQMRSRIFQYAEKVANDTSNRSRNPITLDDVYKDIKFINGKDFMFYSHEESRYARVSFPSMQLREDFMAAAFSEHLFSNDHGSYYRVVARNYDLNLSGWNILRNYTIDNSSKSKAKYCLTMDIADIEGIHDDEQLSRIAMAHDYNPSLVKYENLILSSFDIEMIPEKDGYFPDAYKNPKDEIFMISMTYHFVKRKESLLSIVLTLKKADPLDNALIVYCANEGLLLLAFARFMKFMQPDLITEFNGGGFDWRNIIKKAEIKHVLPDFLRDMSITKLENWETSPSMLKRFHTERRIKINGSTPDAICMGLKLSGFIGFDTLIVFKQLEPGADSHKLNECLRRCNLGSKDDMDIREMFRIYKKGTSSEMRLVAHYCFIDTFKLQQLLIKKNVVQDHREVANLSYTSLFDTFYFAGGSRMRNLLMNRAQKLGYLFDTTYTPDVADPEAKFPGAYVVPPIKGIVRPPLRLDEFNEKHQLGLSENQVKDGYQYIDEHFDEIYTNPKTIKIPEPIHKYVEYVATNETQYPVAGLDYASLYPSIIITYNISPEKLIVDESYANQMQAIGKTLQFVTFPFCGEMIKAWFVRHNNIPEDYSVCGQLLIELFERRTMLKKTLKHYDELIYEMEQEMKSYTSENEYPRLDEYNETCFDYAGCDSKQRAVKIFMNTLYGAMGETRSFICAIQVAASVTTMGRYNLKLARSVVVDDLGMKVYYGDTDSLYVSCNKKHFADHDKAYFTGMIDKIEYGTKLVETTFKNIEIAKQHVNARLIEDNGSKHLKMAYEEVLYPVAFLSKKKYYGVPHVKNVDFYPKRLFLRGLEIVKRGASDVLKDIVNDVVRKAMDIRSTDDIIEIIKRAIRRFFTTDWEISAFAKAKVYRPDKNNVSVKTMMRRYKDMGYANIPEPNVRFKAVICKYYPWEFALNGCISRKLAIGDRMELVERVINEGLEIDLEYYFENELTGQFARLITFCDQFVQEDVIINNEARAEMNEIERDAFDKEQYQRAEDAVFKAAKRFIIGLAKKYSRAFINKGSLYKDTWKTINGWIDKRHHVLPLVIRFEASNLDQWLLEWAKHIIITKYKTTHNELTLVEYTHDLSKFISSESLEQAVMNFHKEWKEKAVMRIRDDYDFAYICRSDVSFDKLDELVDTDEIDLIIDQTIPISNEQAIAIIDKMAYAIGRSMQD